MSKVMVGMSGGVDSAVAAYLLKQQGYEVIGVMLRTWDSTVDDTIYSSINSSLTEADGTNNDGAFEVVQNKCCEIDDARDTAQMLGIEFHAFNCVKDFKCYVVEPFVKEYICGRTPNPCVECNRYVKFEKLLYFANVLGCDYIATGHYAKKVKLENGRITVKRSDALNKDQTYMLYKLSQEQLERVIFPLGEYDKAKVREIAKEAGIPVAEKKDSQEICFIPDDDYAGFILRTYKQLHNSHVSYSKDEAIPLGCFDGALENTGDFIDKNGKVLGKHKGIINYTVGQRKGLGLSMGHPVYVCKLVPSENQVVIGDEEDLFSSIVEISDFNFMSIPELEIGQNVRGNIKIRYHHAGEWAMIERISPNRLKLTFDKPVKSATPGQSAVFYDEDGCVIGGGIIRSEAI